jgi:hypothetical protein
MLDWRRPSKNIPRNLYGSETIFDADGIRRTDDFSNGEIETGVQLEQVI